MKDTPPNAMQILCQFTRNTRYLHVSVSASVMNEVIIFIGMYYYDVVALYD